jgi:hypothetical protein
MNFFPPGDNFQEESSGDIITNLKEPKEFITLEKEVLRKKYLQFLKKNKEKIKENYSKLNKRKIKNYKIPNSNSDNSIINKNKIPLFIKPNNNPDKSIINKNRIPSYKFPSPKYKIIRNNHIPRNLKQLKEGETYNKCNEKTGYVFLPNKIISLKNLPMQIIVIPIYLILTKNSLKFLMGPNEKSMFNEILLENIQKITQIYSNSYCFDIVENDAIEKTLTKGPISICSRNEVNMKNWITAIQEFKECNINIQNHYNDIDNDIMQNKVLIDFEKVNQLLKPQQKLNKIPKEFDPLFYNKEGYNKKPNNEIELSKVLNKIVYTIEGENINEKKITRNFSSEILKAEKFAFDIKRKTKILDDLIQKREMREKDKEEKLIKYETKARELRLLKAVLGRIKQYKVFK